MTQKASLTAIVTGLVQGVNFRDFIRQKARGLHLGGFIRNLPDGSVEVLAEGEKPGLDMLVQYIKQGPPRANVKHVSVSWGQVQGTESNFNIRY
jgi:acylphosphatase